MKLKHLEAALQDMAIFEQPKVHLEQYPTTPHLAACVLYEAHNKFDDIQDRAVLDLGCGTCMLSTAAKILGAGYVCGVDVDGDALEIAQRNIEEMEVDIDLVQCDIARLAIALSIRQGSPCADDSAHDTETQREIAAARCGDAASQGAEGPNDDDEEESTEKQYQCEHDCGFVGSYDEVSAHESSCSFAGEEEEGDWPRESPQEPPAVRDAADAAGGRQCQDLPACAGPADAQADAANETERAGASSGQRPSLRRSRRFCFDTVLMNPPFGTRCKGMDLLFLYTGLCCARRAVYSMHKTSTRDGLAKRLAKWGITYQVIAELKFDLPASYDFHKKKNVIIQVDLVRLEIPERWHRPCPADDATAAADMLELLTGLRQLAAEVGSNADAAPPDREVQDDDDDDGAPRQRPSGPSDSKKGSRGRGARRGRR